MFCVRQLVFDMLFVIIKMINLVGKLLTLWKMITHFQQLMFRIMFYPDGTLKQLELFRNDGLVNLYYCLGLLNHIQP